LSEFKPTIIVIEVLPKNDSLRQISYLNYIQNPNIKFEIPDEIELLAYEVGRLSGATKIYGIDFKESYNGKSIGEVAEKLNQKFNLARQ